MKFVAAVLAVASSLLLGSCGGGGAAGTTEGGILRIGPIPATFYAGVPHTIIVTGGRMPYTMASSDPTVLSIPVTVNSSTITVVPNNPGVIDSGLQPGEVPRKTVTVSARDMNGLFFETPIAVLQNFLTGYGNSMSSTCPSASPSDPPAAACGGGESILTLFPVSQGTLYGLRAFRLQVLRGDYQFVVPETPTNNPPTLANDVTVVTDHEGKAIVRLRVRANAPTQLATYRVTDVLTGTYTDTVFTISGGTPANITAIPTSVTFTGALSTQCGTGSAQILLFDGTPPYTAISTNSNVTVVPVSPNGQPGVFTVLATNDAICGAFPVIFQDANGARVTVTVTTAAGSGTLPPLAIAPTTHTIGCASSASSTIIGGSGSYSVNSGDPSRVTAVVSGNTITFTRNGGPLAGGGNVAVPVVVSDGGSLVTITVNVPATCT